MPNLRGTSTAGSKGGMHARKVVVRAENAAKALQLAAERLDTDPDNVSMTPRTAGGYEATLKNLDAEIDVEISKDGIEATIVSFAPAEGTGRPLSDETIREQLEAAGVVVEPDPQGLARLLDGAEKGSSVRGIVIARGSPPSDGKDGRFEAAIDMEKSVGAIREDGTVDFYELGTVRSVQQGAVLGRLTPHEKGTPGQDVRGRVLRAADGKMAGVSAGRNVQASEDGLELCSTIDGVVVFDGKTLSVIDTYEVAGDVDFKTGNIRVDYGAVKVRKTIRSGFTVTCGGDLTVGEAIENAFVEAGGDVTVRRGIVMRKGGHVKAGGNVSAHFVENALIQAGGNLTIDNDVTNCDVTASGKIIATRAKGRIQGGTVRSGEGVEANQIGSGLSVPTTIIVGFDPEGHDELVADKEELETTLHNIETTLGTGGADEILERTPAARFEAVVRLLEARADARERLQKMEVTLARHRRMLRSSSEGRVTVKRALYPGTLVTIGGRRFEVQDLIKGTELYYDPEIDAICSTADQDNPSD